MKNILLKLIIASTIAITSCSMNKEELVVGDWKVDDVQFSTITTDDTIRDITINQLETFQFNIQENGKLAHSDQNTNNVGTWKLDGYDFSYNYAHTMAPQKKKVKILKLDETNMVWLEKLDNKETITYFLIRQGLQN
jgi:hypothetical protein